MILIKTHPHRPPVPSVEIVATERFLFLPEQSFSCYSSLLEFENRKNHIRHTKHGIYI